MLIGNGMIAKAFSEFKDDTNVIIFASGVSNSKETDISAFKREFDLIKEHKQSEAKFIYFSTCSLFDPSLSNSLYVVHKKKTETFITQNFNNYWIIRLPNVIGKSNNPNTMTNFLYNSIKNNIAFELQENAYRYFIDVDDVKNSVSKLITYNRLKNGTYNLLYPKAIAVISLVALIEKYLQKKALYKLKEKQGSFYKVENSNELLTLINFDTIDIEYYISRIITKYY